MEQNKDRFPILEKANSFHILKKRSLSVVARPFFGCASVPNKEPVSNALYNALDAQYATGTPGIREKRYC